MEDLPKGDTESKDGAHRLALHRIGANLQFGKKKKKAISKKRGKV